MGTHNKRLLTALRKEKTDRVPFWFMRQAGRYLPEYRELRGRAGGFLDFCYNPAMASEATLQPIRRFGMDGAIIFSDILVVPQALGVGVRFEENVGPVLDPVQTEDALDNLSLAHIDERLEPVYEALRRTKAALPEETTLIGFAGAPWTLACYVVDGRSNRDFEQTRRLSAEQPTFFTRLIALLADAASRHAINQIKAGAEVIQIFDSWAGILDERQFGEWSIGPTRDIVRAIKDKYPDVPVIGFPRQAGDKYGRYAQETGVDAVSIDPLVSLEWSKKQLQPICTVQGNLDPLALTENTDAMLEEARRIIATLADKPFVFNLGHGILPHTPVAHMQALCDFLKDPANYT